MCAVIVGVDREVGMEWLGRPLDGRFLAHVRRLRAAGKRITSNSVQTTVVESPLFRGRVRVVSQQAVPGRFLGFLRMTAAAGRLGPRSGERRPCP
jgi:diphthamide synthase (EF-2-diphthine--ammonia ligase)